MFDVGCWVLGVQGAESPIQGILSRPRWEKVPKAVGELVYGCDARRAAAKGICKLGTSHPQATCTGASITGLLVDYYGTIKGLFRYYLGTIKGL